MKHIRAVAFNVIIVNPIIYVLEKTRDNEWQVVTAAEHAHRTVTVA
jgi:hypothetical protein